MPLVPQSFFSHAIHGMRFTLPLPEHFVLSCGHHTPVITRMILFLLPAGRTTRSFPAWVDSLIAISIIKVWKKKLKFQKVR